MFKFGSLKINYHTQPSGALDSILTIQFYDKLINFYIKNIIVKWILLNVKFTVRNMIVNLKQYIPVQSTPEVIYFIFVSNTILL